MKKLILYILLGCLPLAACNDWLDISPRDQVRADEVFEDPSAMKDALIGVYIKMRGGSTYGGGLVWGNIERLAQHWDESLDSDWGKYNYLGSALINSFNGWYGELYSIIADVNVMLQEIDAKKSLFDPGEFELVKGELLGVRAFCHFDLLRLFGPVPTEPGTGLVLPYVEIVSIHPHPFHTYADYIAKIERDLTEAYDLMKDWDPVVTTNMADLYTVGLDSFWEDRQLRMNYYAVTAMLARFYLWTGQGPKANAMATEIIDSKYFKLGGESGMNKSDYDYSLASEHIFAMSIVKLYETTNKSFGSSDEPTSYNKTRERLVELFDGESGSFDIRLKTLWHEYTVSVAKYNTIKKYWVKEEPYGQIPLIRLSEMYLIAIETGTQEQINELFGEFYPLRGMAPPSDISPLELRNRIIREYQREFYAEGQGFYAYKRLNVEDLLWTSYKGSSEIYVLPLPDSEIRE